MLDLIRRRRSMPRFTGAPVPRAVVEHMLEAATSAANHHLTEPWQFFVLQGEHPDLYITPADDPGSDTRIPHG